MWCQVRGLLWMLMALLVHGASSEGSAGKPRNSKKLSGLGVKNNHANRVLPFHALGIDTAGEGKPLPSSGGIFELFVAGKLKMKQPLPQTLRQRQAIALSNVAAVAGMVEAGIMAQASAAAAHLIAN